LGLYSFIKTGFCIICQFARTGDSANATGLFGEDCKNVIQKMFFVRLRA